MIRRAAHLHTPPRGLPRYLALAALALGFGTHGAEDPQSELATVVERLNALDTWLDDAGSRLTERQRQFADVDRKIADNVRQVRNLDEQVDAAEDELHKLRAEGRRLDKARREQQQLVSAHLRDAWRFSERDPLKLWLNQEDPAALERLARYHTRFAETRGKVINDLRGTAEMIRRTETELGNQQRQLEALRGSLLEQRQSLANERASRARLISELQSDLDARSREHEQLAASRERLGSLLARLEQDSGPVGRQDGIGTKGDLPWPVEGQVQHRFGEARTRRTRWQGVYFRAPTGSEVRSIAPGRVAFADWLRGFGLLAIVDHGDDRMSLYGAADSLYVRLGDRVERGEPIASVGQSGGHSAVGLYFEIRESGKPTDPLAWLARR